MTGAPDEGDFRALYEGHVGAVHGYFARRVPPADAGDLVADVFVVAWRRWAEMPAAADERRMWLFGVARRVLADCRKSARRRDRLAQRLRTARGAGAQPPLEPGRPASDADALLAAALAQLSPADREVLALVAWDRLSHAEAASLLGCTVNAFDIRLHRARKRLASRYSALAGRPAGAGDAPANPRPAGQRSVP